MTLKMKNKNKKNKHIFYMLILGNRIPYEYFITKGKGETDAESNFLPFETGSYDVGI